MSVDGNIPQGLQASSPSCQLLQTQGYLCSATKEPRNLREVGMREEGIFTQRCTTSKRHRAVLTPQGRRKEAVPVLSWGRKGSRSRADCLSLPSVSSHTGWEHCLAELLLLGTRGRDRTPQCQGQNPTVPRFAFWSMNLGEGGRLDGFYMRL